MMTAGRSVPPAAPPGRKLQPTLTFGTAKVSIACTRSPLTGDTSRNSKGFRDAVVAIHVAGAHVLCIFITGRVRLDAVMPPYG